MDSHDRGDPRSRAGRDRGRLVFRPERDPGSLAGAIEELIRNPELRKKFAEAGDQNLRENFDADKLIAKLSDKLPRVNFEPVLSDGK